MYFTDVIEEDVEFDKKFHVLEPSMLDNNILIEKQKLDIEKFNLINLDENQGAVIVENNIIHDYVRNKGIYCIKPEKVNDDNYERDFDKYKISDLDGMYILFFNMNEIHSNKFFIKKRITKDFFGEGDFSFKTENPMMLLSKVITMRTVYSREELLEQIRERMSKIMSTQIQNLEEDLAREEYARMRVNTFKRYGIKITSYEFDNLNFIK